MPSSARREASISYQGYGVGSYDVLEQLQLLIDSPLSLATQDTLGGAAILRGPVVDISQLVATEEETRCSFEILWRYRAVSTAAAQVAVALIVVDPVDLTRYDGDTATLDGSFALDGDGNLVAIP